MQRYTDPILARADVSRPLGRVLAPEQAEALRAGGAILTPAEVARDACACYTDGGDGSDFGREAQALADRLESGRGPDLADLRRAEPVAVRARAWHFAQGVGTPTRDDWAKVVRLLDGEVGQGPDVDALVRGARRTAYGLRERLEGVRAHASEGDPLDRALEESC